VCALSVAPETVKIRIEPEELRPGMEAAIICDSSSSNPPAKLSWWKDGIPIEGTYGMAWPAWLFGPGQAICEREGAHYQRQAANIRKTIMALLLTISVSALWA